MWYLALVLLFKQNNNLMYLEAQFSDLLMLIIFSPTSHIKRPSS